MSVRDDAILEAAKVTESVYGSMSGLGGKELALKLLEKRISIFEESLAKAGFRIMPVEPSAVMIDAGMFAAEDSGHPQDIWSCMVASAHGPGEVGNAIKNLTCSECGAVVTLVDAEPGGVAVSGAEGWSMFKESWRCPIHSAFGG